MIEALRRGLPGPPGGEVWIGDDAAVLAPVDGVLLLTTDLSVEGVHGDLGLIGLDDLGWRAMTAAVSDIAAMGGRAHRAVVGVAGPPSTDVARLYEGIGACAELHRCPVVGGDLSGAVEVVVAVTVTQAASSRRRGAHPTLAAANSDDVEDAHRRPRARLAEGEVARLAGATAMIDVSDGLLAELGHIADASAVGFRLDGVPIAAGATREEALGGGEDYELVVATSDPDGLVRAFAAAGLRPPVAVGTCCADPSERTLEGGPVPAVGYEHDFG
ncbi:MAG: thiamine-phosphate kinase [Acidimicrobiales bacterium]